MKIKISKSQWEKAGMKAGWVTSKIRDLSPVKNVSKPVICSGCGRWGVDGGWKYYYQMSDDEKQEVAEIKRKFEEGATTFISEVCEKCK